MAGNDLVLEFDSISSNYLNINIREEQVEVSIYFVKFCPTTRVLVIFFFLFSHQKFSFWSQSTVGGAFVLHAANPGLILVIPYGPLITTRSDS